MERRFLLSCAFPMAEERGFQRRRTRMAGRHTIDLRGRKIPLATATEFNGMGWDRGMALLRFIACAVIVVGGLGLLIGGNPNAYDAMLFPLVGFLPAAIFTAGILYPIERFALVRDRAAHLMWVLPVAGAMFPFLATIVLALLWGNPGAVVRLAHPGPADALPMAMGFIWGLLWWISGVVARLLRPAGT